MMYRIFELQAEHIPFVCSVYSENLDVLHGSPISREMWEECLLANPDPTEVNFVIFADKEPAAWLKINGLDQEILYVSMLVVAKEHQRNGVGRFALQFAEQYAASHKKDTIVILTTKDNISAVRFYLSQDYSIDREIRYAAGDEIVRDGYRFCKKISSAPPKMRR